MEATTLNKWDKKIKPKTKCYKVVLETTEVLDEGAGGTKTTTRELGYTNAVSEKKAIANIKHRFNLYNMCDDRGNGSAVYKKLIAKEV